MTSLIRRSRNFIHRNLGVLNNRVLVGTHHKTGTAWMSKIFKEIASNYNLKYSSPTASKGILVTPTQNFDIFFQTHSRFDLEKISNNYKGLHIIRDPRDIIVSACFYHMKSSEEWLHIKSPAFGGLTYQEKLNSYSSLDDKLFFEMENSSKITIQDIKNWDYNNSNFIEIKYENLIRDNELILFKEIFEFLGFRKIVTPNILEIAFNNSLFSGKVKKSVHVRSGQTQQWKKYLTPLHEKRFFELFGDVLVKLNYAHAATGWIET